MLGALRQEIISARHQSEIGLKPGWIGVPLVVTSHTGRTVRTSSPIRIRQCLRRCSERFRMSRVCCFRSMPIAPWQHLRRGHDRWRSRVFGYSAHRNPIGVKTRIFVPRLQRVTNSGKTDGGSIARDFCTSGLMKFHKLFSRNFSRLRGKYPGSFPIGVCFGLTAVRFG